MSLEVEVGDASGVSFDYYRGEDAVVERYQEITRQRRINDSIWDFLHFSDSLKPPTWISHTVALLRADLTDSLNEKFAVTLNILETAPWTYLHYAMWFTCVTLYREMRDFLVLSPDIKRCNQQMTAAFIDQRLPLLVQDWLTGHYALAENFVMHVCIEYVVSVPCTVQQ